MQLVLRVKEKGRVLSKSNEEKLRVAVDQMTQILAKLGIDSVAKEADQPLSYSDLSRELCCATRDKLAAATGGVEVWCYVADVFPDGTYVYSVGGEYFKASYAVDAANRVTVGDPTPVTAQVVYTTDAEPDGLMECAYQSDIAPLTENSIREAGKAYVKVIAPGWGSSGYYPASVLERDGPKVYPKGTKMYWNHQTRSEEMSRPEGDLRDLAAVTAGDARWDPFGPAGAGLYAHADIFERYQTDVKDLAPHIGVSIRGMGLSREGEREGRTGQVFERLISGKSIDFVTQAGAGGQIVNMFEAAGRRPEERRDDPMTADQIRELSEARQQAKAADDRAVSAQKTIEAMQLQLHRTEAREVARGTLAASKLPEAAKARVLNEAVRNVPLKDGQLDTVALEANIAAAITAEQTYLESLGLGGIRGASRSAAPAEMTDGDFQKELEGLLVGAGMKESTAKIAAAGR